ncbi:MAG: hypothetical protein ACKVT0_12665 [Planctomycetaceae bacterium]
MKAVQFIDAMESIHNKTSAQRMPGAALLDRVDDETCEPLDDLEVVGSTLDVKPGDVRTLGLVEMILKNRDRLHGVIRHSELTAELIPRLLAISLIGFTFFGICMSLVLSSSGTWPHLTAVKDYLDGNEPRLIAFPELQMQAPADAGGAAPNPWWNGSAIKMILAYSIGLIAATGVCLPSLYFYGLLAGIKMSMLDVTIHALKCKATSAVALIGILPVYAAISMGMVIFGATPSLMQTTLILGLVLPFFSGVWGIKSMYAGFSGLCDTLPEVRRDRRACFLRRLVLSWSVCYMAIMPVMIFTLWQALGT